MKRLLLLLIVLIAALAAPSAQSRITTPKAFFGFNLGDDYQLANYRQIANYWHKLDSE